MTALQIQEYYKDQPRIQVELNFKKRRIEVVALATSTTYKKGPENPERYAYGISIEFENEYSLNDVTKMLDKKLEELTDG